MKRSKGILPTAMVVGFAIAASPASISTAEAAQIRTGAVCKAGTSFCIHFTSTSAIPLVSGFTFTAPTAGTALVSFNGSMQCVNLNSSPTGEAGVIDLTTQILISAAEIPNYQAPGGSRIAMRLPPANRSGLPPDIVFTDRSAAINLASSRVVPLTPGAHAFVFKIVRNRMDSTTSCTVFNGNFNVVFVP